MVFAGIKLIHRINLHGKQDLNNWLVQASEYAGNDPRNKAAVAKSNGHAKKVVQENQKWRVA